jgi:hypothetical protein
MTAPSDRVERPPWPASLEVDPSASPAPSARALGDPGADTALLLQSVLDGTADPAAIEWLRRGFVKWLQSGAALTLPACLGLHARPFLIRIALRDFWLRDAGRCIEQRSDWGRAKALHAAARQFLGYPWPVWKRAAEPPWARCTRLQACLFFAAKAHADFPESVRQYFNILCETKAPDDFTPGPLSLPGTP